MEWPTQEEIKNDQPEKPVLEQELDPDQIQQLDAQMTDFADELAMDIAQIKFEIEQEMAESQPDAKKNSGVKRTTGRTRRATCRVG